MDLLLGDDATYYDVMLKQDGSTTIVLSTQKTKKYQSTSY